MTKLFRLLTALIDKLWMSIKRFPLAILMAIAAVIVFILLNHLDIVPNDSTHELLTRIGLVFALGFPLFLSIKVFFERKSRIEKSARFFVQAAALAFLLMYFLLFLKDLSHTSGIRYTLYSIVLYLMFLIIPQLKNRENYELYVINMFVRFTVTYLYSLILYGGISALIGSTQILFKLSISGKIYLDILIVIAGVFAPIYFLGDLPVSETRSEAISYPKVLRILFLYIILPIVTAFTVILYVYFLTILFSPWPNNTIFKIIFWFSTASILILFFVYPLRKVNKWANFFITVFPKILLPLQVLMFITMIIRIKAYGITELRYFLIVLSLWSICSVVLLGVKKNARTLLLPASLAVVAFLTVTGPWNAYSLTKFSQSSRFYSILKSYDMINDNSIVKPQKEISGEDKDNLSSIISYYNRNYSLHDLQYLPKDFTIDKMRDVLGFSMTEFEGNPPNVLEPDRIVKNNYFSYDLNENGTLINIKDYDYLISMSGTKTEVVNFSEGTLQIAYSTKDYTLKLSKDHKEIYNKNLTEIIAKLHEANGSSNILSQEKMKFSDDNRSVSVIYLFKHINGEELDNGKFRLEYVDYDVLIKVR